MACLILGFLLLTGFAFTALKKWKWYKSCLTSEGTILEVVERNTSNSDGRGSHKTHFPIVEFKLLANNKIYQFENGVGGTTYKKGAEGTIVKVIYNPDNPNDAKINTFFSIWLLEFVLGLLGLLFCTCGVLVLLNVFPQN